MVQKYELPKLAYTYEGLEPVLSKELVEIHYTKHHAAYVTNLNKALEELEEAEKKGDLTKQITLHQSIKFNGGGHINHTLYWENLAPRTQNNQPTGQLLEALKQEFQSVDLFQEKIARKACAIQGSGWAWLGYNQEQKRLEIETTANHDLLLSTKGLHPLLCIDMWEHAFYLSYKNVKTEYAKTLWSIINWKVVEERFQRVSNK